MYIQNRNRLTDIDNKLAVTRGKREGVRLRYGIKKQTTMCKINKQQDILCNTGNYTHYLVITYNGI